MTPDTTAAIVLIAGSLLWLVAGCVRIVTGAAEDAESERPTLPPSDTPIHDELAAERFRADLADDEVLGRWAS